jgi:hypothetical protein
MIATGKGERTLPSSTLFERVLLKKGRGQKGVLPEKVYPSLYLPFPTFYPSLLSIPSTSPNQSTFFTKSKKRTGVLQKRTKGGAGRTDKERK